MLAKKILENLKNGNYRIVYSEKCDCEFYWYVKDGEFVCDTIKNNGCYYNNVLIMDDLADEFDDEIVIDSNGVIASYDNNYGVNIQILCSYQDIAYKIFKYIVEDPEIYRDLIASINYPDNCNDLHIKRRDKAFVEFIKIRKEMILWKILHCLIY